jgi:hypothetical protein
MVGGFSECSLIQDAVQAFPPKSLHFPSIATNGIVTLIFFLFTVPTVRFTASNSRTRSIVYFYILGGTADITVHEKASNGQLKELCRATGNNCGGTSIDARFFKVLQDVSSVYGF